MTYEYVVFELTNKSKDVEKALNEWGDWEYKIKNFHVNGDHVQIIMEREYDGSNECIAYGED